MPPNFNQTITNELEILEKKLVEYLLTPNEPTNQVLLHIFSSGGKRIRPSVFLLCSQLVEYEGPHMFSIAAICEYIHTASLLHDDVIDNSSLRRNKSTVNSVWGDETAILSGDLIYAAACRLMVKTKSLELIDDFAECIRFMSESELYQLELLWNKNTTTDQYYKVILGKTAILFQTSAKSACYLNSNYQNIAPYLAEYGKNLGLAFQIFDDCLDYKGDESILGKAVITDLLEGKVTLPLIFSLKSSHFFSNNLTLLIDSIMETGKASTHEKSELLNFVKETGGLKKAFLQAENHSQKARDALLEIEKMINLSSKQQKALDALNKITYFVLNRKN